MVQVEVLETPQLGDRSYLVHDGEVGVVVDPQRDVDWILELAEKARVRIACVAETHIHNDYLSGGLVLSDQLQVPYLVAATEEVDFIREPVHDGQEIAVGSFRLRATATPGHTPGHLSYLVLEDDAPVALLSGGSLLYGSVGRTDLLGDELTESLSRAQHRSVRMLAGLPDDVELLPTHGFGSFCASGPPSGDKSSTIGREKTVNSALRQIDEDAFVAELTAHLGPFPSYYARMAPRNRSGVTPADRSLEPLRSVEELVEAIAAGHWVVDLRHRNDFARAHLAGSVGFEHAEPFSTYLGWLLPWGSPITLVSDRTEVTVAAQRDLARIGIDTLSGTGQVDLEAWAASPVGLRSYPLGNFAALKLALEDPSTVVLDVRRDEEWSLGHVAGAVHIPLHLLLERTDEVPEGTVWVHCASGYRASIATSLLDRAGREVVLIGDEVANADRSGLFTS